MRKEKGKVIIQESLRPNFVLAIRSNTRAIALNKGHGLISACRELDQPMVQPQQFRTVSVVIFISRFGMMGILLDGESSFRFHTSSKSLFVLERRPKEF